MVLKQNVDYSAYLHHVLSIIDLAMVTHTYIHTQGTDELKNIKNIIKIKANNRRRAVWH